MKLLLLMAGILTSAAALSAQPLDVARGGQAPPTPAGAPLPKFEVTSVKRNTSGDGFTTVRMAPPLPGYTNAPVRQVIVRAFGVQPFQVVGGPSWLNDRF